MKADAPTLLAHALHLVRASPFGFFVTEGRSGPDSRLVAHLDVDDRCGVWFATSVRSRKAEAIRIRPRVAYSVEDRPTMSYVTVLGPADLVGDRERCAELWDRWGEVLQPFWSGPDDDDLVLVHVRPDAVELTSYGEGIHPEPLGGAGAWRLSRTTGGWDLSTTS